MATDAPRDSNGRWLEPHPGKHTITKADASTLAKKRWEKYRRAAVERIVGEAQAVDMSISTGADAFALVASKQYVALLDYDKPRIDELDTLGKMMAGYDPKSAEQSPVQQVTDLTNAVTGLLKAMQAQLHDSNPEVIDAE